MVKMSRLYQIHVRPVKFVCQLCGGCDIYCFEDFVLED